MRQGCIFKPVTIGYRTEMASAAKPLKRLVGHPRWLGPNIDAAAIDARKTRWQRMAAGAIAAVLIAANLSIEIGASWISVCYAAELLSWLASRRLHIGRGGSTEDRIYYLIALTLSTFNWSFASLLYWFNGSPGF